MKKIMIIEIAVLIVLLIVAIAVCAKVANNEPAQEPPESSPNAEQTTTEPSEEETTVPEETTEPGPTWMTVPAGRQLLAQQYFVYDVNNDTFVTSSASPDERVWPASVTKLFTAYVAMQFVEPDRPITAGDALDQVAWGSSVAKLGKGDTLTAEQLVEAMLLPSGNDAAYVLAAEAGRVIADDFSLNGVAAVMTFMEEMNRQAKEVGMTGSHFVNPDGIHSDDHYMSYADLCLLGKLALQNETIMKYANVATDVVSLPSQLTAENPASSTNPDLEPGQVEWKNTNKLIHEGSDYYCPYAIGLKTGQTPTAGSCLLSAFEMDGKQWIIGVFGCPEEDDRFDDTIQLFNDTIGS